MKTLARASITLCSLALLAAAGLGADPVAELWKNAWGEDAKVHLKISREGDPNNVAITSICVGDKPKLTATIDPPAGGYDSANLSIWKGDSSIASGTSSPLETVYQNALSVGNHTFTAQATIHKGGKHSRTLAPESKTVTVVGVEKIIVEGSNPQDEGPAYCAKGGTIRLEALANPNGASFPAGHPEWSIESKPQGSDLDDLPDGSATVAVKPDVAGEYVVKAACGTSSDTFTIQVSQLRITAVEFVSDHNLLKDKDDDYQDGGVRYNNVEWQIETETTAEINDPMTHTWDSKVELKVTVQVEAGAAAPGNLDITASGLGNFSLLNQTPPAAGETATYTILAASKLEKKIEINEKSINWTIKQAGTNTKLLSQSTGSHKLYMTVGTPDTSGGDSSTTVTVWRMERALPIVKAAITAGKEDCHPNTVWNINKSQGDYYLYRNLASPQDKPWLLPDSAGMLSKWTNPPSPDPEKGADCITISKYVRNVCMVMGVPGTFGTETYYALYAQKPPGDADRPKKAVSGNLSNPNVNPGADALAAGLDPNWVLGLADSNCTKFGGGAEPGTVGCGPDGLNGFEAAVIYTYDNKTYYFPGGTDHFYDDKDHVVQVFETLVWVGLGDHDNDNDTDPKPVVKAVDYTYTTPPNAQPCP